MRRAISAILYLLSSIVCLSQSAVQYRPVDFIGYTPNSQQIDITPLWNYTPSGTTNIAHGGKRSFSTGTIIASNGVTLVGIPGSLTVSNMLWGAYRVEFFLQGNGQGNGNGHAVATFTNVFTNNTPAFVNAVDHFGVATNMVLENGYAYTIAQMNLIVSNLQYEIDNSTGPGGGISLTQGSNIVNGSTGVIKTNGAARGTMFIFSQQGTNDIQGFPLIAPWANWGTNVFGSAAFTSASAYDAAGAGTTAATAATNNIGLSSGLAAFSPTNRYVTHIDPQGYTNASSAGTTVTNLGDAANTNFVFSDKNGGLFYGSIGSGLTYNAATHTLSAPTGGAGDMVAANNLSDVANTGTALHNLGGVSNAWAGALNIIGPQSNSATFSVLLTMTNFGGVVQKSGVTNEALTASSLVKSDANKKLSSVANASGVLTNDASGGIGYDNTFAHTNQLVSWAGVIHAGQLLISDPSLNPTNTLDGSILTNLVIHTHEGTTTNITVTFNGTMQSFTCTNGPSIGQHYWFHFAGANGSASFRFVGSSYNNIHFDYDPTWISGSNSVMTNGVLSFTSYGGTNAAQIMAAMKEKQ